MNVNVKYIDTCTFYEIEDYILNYNVASILNSYLKC
jgi:hypothetical protein